MKDIRLILTANCNRTCEKCCNKQYKDVSIPDFDWTNLIRGIGSRERLRKEMTVLITGGEPMLYKDEVRTLADKIHRLSTAKVILYTAWHHPEDLYRILFHVEGLTLTLHEQKDVDTFLKLNEKLTSYSNRLHTTTLWSKSLRLNVFNTVKLPDRPYVLWDVHQNLEWQDDCPVSENEVLMKWKGVTL